VLIKIGWEKTGKPYLTTIIPVLLEKDRNFHVE
jgi:hypothetical protein